MKLVSVIYGLVVAIRKRLYACGFFSSYRPKAFTVSVGNIVAGGAGKTPCTLFLAELLHAYGPVAIISRPYKAEAENCRVPFQVDPSKHAAKLVGDEALLMARRLPSVSVWVGKKAKAAQMADSFGAKVIIVDDGFQHFALKRDLDIVLLDAESPLRGLCREPLSTLTRASCIFLNCRTFLFDTTLLKNELRRYTQAPIVTVSYKTEGFYDLTDKKVAPPKKIALFTAIAHPEQYTKTVESLGFEVVDRLYGKDHEAFSSSQLEEFADRARSKGAEALFCTEKDRVKLVQSFLLVQSHLPIFWLKISLVIENKEELAIITRLLYAR